MEEEDPRGLGSTNRMYFFFKEKVFKVEIRFQFLSFLFSFSFLGDVDVLVYRICRGKIKKIR